MTHEFLNNGRLLDTLIVYVYGLPYALILALSFDVVRMEKKLWGRLRLVFSGISIKITNVDYEVLNT